MKCSCRHTFAQQTRFLEVQLPLSLPLGARLVEAYSLQSESRPNSLRLYPLKLGQQRPTPFSQRGGPTPSSLPRNSQGGPERRPTPFASSTLFISLGCRFCCFLTLQGFMGLKHLMSTLLPTSPFSATQSCCYPWLILRINKRKLIIYWVTRTPLSKW